MGRKRYTVEAIVRMLREAEVELSGGVTIKRVSKKLGINEKTYYRWRKRVRRLADGSGQASEGRLTCKNTL